MENDFLTPSEIADTLRVTRHTVNAWLISGLLHGYQVGRRWRVPRHSLEAFMQAADNSRSASTGAESSPVAEVAVAPVVAASPLANRKNKRRK